jgi:hypothetical protein
MLVAIGAITLRVALAKPSLQRRSERVCEEKRMNQTASWRWLRNALMAAVALAFVVIWGCGGDDSPSTSPSAKADCTSGDNIETGLQGQTTVAERMGGSAAKGLNCNLQLIGQSAGEGAYHAQTWIDDCSYYSTANGATQRHPGVAVIDVSDPVNPKPTAYLNAASMLQTWESLKISTARKLLAAVESEGGSGLNPGFAVYDVTDCKSPVLKASVNLPIPPGTTIKGHAGAMAPDGRTYYGSTYPTSIYIVDIVDPTSPQLMLNWVPPDGIGASHDLSISKDGNRAYVMQPGTGPSGKNGIAILDVSDFNARKANPQVRVVGTHFWTDGGIAMTSEQIAIGGKAFLLVSDELQAGTRTAACANGTPVFAFGRLVDVTNEASPFTVSELKLEVDDPKNCAKLANDPAYLTTGFGYSSHYCTADNREDTHLVACSRHEAGIRVFDVRDPAHPKEVAYYKPPIHTGADIPGSGINGVPDRTYDWNKSHSRFLNRNGRIELWTTSADNGFQTLAFNPALVSKQPDLFSKVPTSLSTITVP